MDVNIYVDSTIKNPNRGEGTAMYLLECIVKNEPKTIEGFVHLPDTTEDAIILTALIEALGRLIKPTTVRIFTKSRGVFGAINTGSIQTAKTKGFRNAKGQSVKNAELWSIFLSFIPKYKWTITQEDHSFEKYMKAELKKWQDQ
jgi:ribonuclease HI